MELGLLVLRAIVGALFIGHGAQKLFGWFGGHGPAATSGMLESIGLRPGRPMALAAGTAEVLGGLLFVAGLLTPVAAALMTAVMACAIWTVHRTNGLWNPDGGYEYNLVLIAVAVAVTSIGAGEWSLDEAVGLAVSGVGWAIAALAAGLAAALGALGAGRLELGHRTGGTTAMRT